MISYDANKLQYMAFGPYFFWIFQSGLLLEKSIFFIFFFFAYYCLGVKLSKKTSGAKISVQKKITRSGPFTLQFYLPNHRLPNQQGIQGTIMFRYRLCDRQHFWRLSMGSKMPYSMLHNLHSNQTNRFEILHFLLNYKSWNKRYQNHRNYYSNK